MLLSRIQRRLAQLSELLRRVEELQQAVGRLETRLTAGRNDQYESLADYEFRVFSQWGEDGIIQFLIRTIPITRAVFVEFGVQDYKEANTRFLLQNNDWSGLVIDASEKDVDVIRKDTLYFRHELQAICAFVDRDNINELISRNGISGDVGLLSIDIDGNDYWVWEGITCISPRIVICEYDNLLGCEKAVVSPYDPKFERGKAHPSWLYGGASLPALERLARMKGYTLIGSNSTGNNAFFVRNDLLSSLRPVTSREVYRRAHYRSSRSASGALTFLNFEESLEAISSMPLIDLETGTTITVRDISP